MELSDDVAKMLESLSISELLDLRKTDENMKDIIDNSNIWCIRLEKDFGIENKDMDKEECFNLYNDLYMKVKSFYNTFLLATPFIVYLFDLDEDPIDSFQQSMYQAQGNPSKNRVEKLKKFFGEKQLHDFFYKYVRANDEGGDFMDVMQFERDNEHVKDDLTYFEEGFYQVSDLLYGLLSPVQYYPIIKHTITNKCLDIFTLAWGGKTEWSRLEKLTFIVKEQNKLYKALVDSGVKLGEEYERYYITDREIKEGY